MENKIELTIGALKEIMNGNLGGAREMMNTQLKINEMKKYTVTTNESLRLLCIKHNWFTCGSNKQYEKLFYANEHGYPIEEIATIIWLCTDEEKWCRKDILAELKSVQEEYHWSICEQQIANGERAADEIYCGYFD